MKDGQLTNFTLYPAQSHYNPVQKKFPAAFERVVEEIQAKHAEFVYRVRPSDLLEGSELARWVANQKYKRISVPPAIQQTRRLLIPGAYSRSSRCLLPEPLLRLQQ